MEVATEPSSVVAECGTTPGSNWSTAGGHTTGGHTADLTSEQTVSAKKGKI